MLVNLFIEKIEILADRTPQPDVIICALPEKIEKHCFIRIGMHDRTFFAFIIYTVSVVFGIAILIYPFPVFVVFSDSVLKSFSTISMPLLIRIIAGYYLTCILPGVLVVLRLPYFNNVNLLEKISLILFF